MKHLTIKLIGLLLAGGIVQAQDATFSGKVLLQGACEPGTSLMRTALIQQSVFPLQQPYNTAPWHYAGTESLSATEAGMVDWILVDLRISPDTTVARLAAILYADGTIRDAGGDSVLRFNVPPGSYYLAILHRSHLAAMTAARTTFQTGVMLDFTDTTLQVYGTCMIGLGTNTRGMIGGDVNQDRVLKYSGSGNDRSPILQRILSEVGGSAINATIQGYFKEDLRMDGTVKYSGSGNDPSLIIQNLTSLTGSNAINSTFTGPVPHPVLMLPPAQPSPIAGPTDPCENATGLIYSVTQVSGVTYTWTVPAGWSITAGQGTAEITVSVDTSFGTIEVGPSNHVGIGNSQMLIVTPKECFLPGYVHCDPTNPTAVVEVINPATGKTWMDRNLGASRVATSSTDAASYGDLYQWGRFADGHQCRTSGLTTTLSATDQPGHANFIILNSFPNDWRSPQNNNLWQDVNGINNPCPDGYRIPTAAELNAERLSWNSSSAAGAFASPLKLPLPGSRDRRHGSLSYIGVRGQYWSSTITNMSSRYLLFFVDYSTQINSDRASGYSVRCIKVGIPDQPSPINGSSSPCEYQTGLVYNVTPEPGITYTWSIPSDWIITSGQGTNQITVATGSLSGTIEVTPSNLYGDGLLQSLIVTTLTIPAQPTSITGNDNPCAGSTETYSVPQVAGLTYTWSIPVGWVIIGGQGTHAISLIVGSAAGGLEVVPSNVCGDGTPKAIVVNSINLPSQPSDIIGVVSPCEGTTGEYSIVQEPGVTYTWTVPTDWIITSGQGTHEIIVNVGSEMGDIEVIPSNICGNGQPQTLTVTTQSIPTQPSEIVGETNPCQGVMETFSIIQDAGVAYTWTIPADWSITDGQGTSQVTVNVGSAAGFITVFPSNACGDGSSQTRAVTTQTVPAQPSVITGEANPCEGTIETYAVNADPDVNYFWTVPTGCSISSGQGTHEIFVTIDSASGAIVLTPTNGCGIGTSQTLAITSLSDSVLPTIKSISATGVTSFSATTGGEISHTGCAAVIARGVVWSTAQTPSIENNLGIISNSVGAASFTSHLLGLTPSTTYFVRAYATNSVGIAYGNEISFTTSQVQSGTTQLTLPLPDPCSSVIPAKESIQP